LLLIPSWDFEPYRDISDRISAIDSTDTCHG
jgi:hypothetical protein